MNLSPDQQISHDALVSYALNPTGPLITLGGYAGTGKTTVTARVVHSLRERGFNNIAFCCFTGKASSVLRQKLVTANALQTSPCGTIHSLIYDTEIKPGGRFIHHRKAALKYDLIVLDEASMVNEDIWNDLSSYRRPIMAIGDHGQLPPICRPGTEAFSLMKNPDFRLEKIHRQQGVENPILDLAHMARVNGNDDFEMKRYGVGVSVCYQKNDHIVEIAQKYGRLRSTLFLAAINNHRLWLNKAIRAALGYKDDRPHPGEKVICLKNNHDALIYNGVTGIVEACGDADQYCYWLRARMDDGVMYEGRVLREQFNAAQTIRSHPVLEPRQMKFIDLFDFGYCLTVHKSQGSEADSVVLLMYRMQSASDDFWRRWLYTGITRAKKYLTVVNRIFPFKSKDTERMDTEYNQAIASTD